MLIQQPELGQRSRSVRRANLSAIARELHLNGSLSRSELVVRTGLTRSAIRGLIGELVAAGLVVEEGASSAGTPGRPSLVVRPEPTAAVVLAMEIAVDSMAAAVVGFGGAILGSARVDRRRGHQSAEAVVAELAELCRPLLETSGRATRFVGSGVAVAGLVRSVDGMVAMAPNIGWRDVPIGPMIEAALQTGGPVVVANDADLGVLAELRRGAAVGAHDVLYISGEVGVGGGLVIGGRPLMGTTGYGGEVGHMTVNPHGSMCRLRFRRLLGDGGRGGDAPPTGRGARRWRPGGGRSRPGRSRGRFAQSARGARSRRPLAGHRAGQPGQRVRPRADRPRRAVRTDPAARHGAGGRRTRPAGPVGVEEAGARDRRPARGGRAAHRGRRVRPRTVARRSGRLAAAATAWPRDPRAHEAFGWERSTVRCPSWLRITPDNALASSPSARMRSARMPDLQVRRGVA